MREYMGLFRGKRIDNGEWVEGNLVDCPQNFRCKRIVNFGCLSAGVITRWEQDVITETVGECTGLKDKNGKLIFEGDILEGMRGLHRVYYDTSLACFEWAKINGNWDESFSGFADEYEIIGNIHDNPELLKSEG